MFFEPILFSVTGAQIKFNELDSDIILIGIICTLSISSLFYTCTDFRIRCFSSLLYYTNGGYSVDRNRLWTKFKRKNLFSFCHCSEGDCTGKLFVTSPKTI